MENNTSIKWRDRNTRLGWLRNALLKSMGYTDWDIDKPIVGIINTWAETNPGHYHFRQLSEAVKRGVWAAGGFPLEINIMSICEVFFDVSSLIYRNMLSATTEELISRHPFDGVVLIGGCDKSVPGQVMGAVSANKPTIFLPGGSMIPGSYKGETLCCGTDSLTIWQRYKAGEITMEELKDSEACLYGSAGACPIMGTANSVQTMVEALGLAMPNSASSLGVSAEKMRSAEEAGRQIMYLIDHNITAQQIITKKSIENAITVLMSSGGSTNVIIHLTAIARRAGIKLDLMEFERISDRTPLLVDVKPHGKHAPGVGFHNAGGVRALMKRLEPLLNVDCLTVSGKTVGENLATADLPYDDSIIRPLNDPISPVGGICVLKGNLAPNGAVIKRSAASPELLKRRGVARVFDSLDEAEAYLLNTSSDMDEEKIIILRGYGPVGAPGMPECGNYLPTSPINLYKKGVKDYIRITDARMSGCAFGTVILHVSPEAAIGGPLAVVKDGDIISVDVDQNLLQLEISDAEMQERLKNVECHNHPEITRGYIRHFIDSVLQADEGCDLNYL